MNEKALKLFVENYENKGICENLETFVKSFEKEFKKAGTKKVIKYLPWAVVERLFRMQGGKIEVLKFRYDVNFEGKDYNPDTGEIELGDKPATFIHLKGTWQGEELEEFYPIFDNQTAKVVRTPDAQQLNTSRQRGSVRLIARLSGIGLWVFEQQDDSYEDNDNVVIDITTKKEDTTIKKETTTKKDTKKDVVTKKAQLQEIKDDAMADVLGAEPISERVEKDEENVANMFFGNVVSDVEEETKEETPKKEPKISQPALDLSEKDYEKGTEQHSDALLKVKNHVKTHKDVILEFRNSKGKELLGDLTYLELQELLSILVK